MSDVRFSQDYSSDDVQQILTIALGKESSSAVQLEEMAKDLSIDRATLDYAVDVWRSHKVNKQEKQQRRQRFHRYELLPYLIVNGFLLVLDISIAGGVTWSIYPLLGWGLGLLLGIGKCDGKHRRSRLVEQSSQVS